MKAIFTRTIKDRALSTFIYIIGETIFLWMYISIFPSMSKQSEELSKAFSAYPESIMKAFGITDMAAMFNHIENFLATENYSFLWPIIAIALVVSIGGYAIAGEIERKTIETLLAQPISRMKLFFAKYLSSLLIYIIFTAATVFVVIPLCKMYDVAYKSSAHISMFYLGLLFGTAIYSLSFLFSAMFSERAKAYFLTAGIVISMYAINIAASLKESLSDMKYFSFFYYFDTNKALLGHRIEPLSIYVFCGTILICTFLSALIFNKRSITVS